MTPLLIIDSYALFFLTLIYAATGLLAMFARPYRASPLTFSSPPGHRPCAYRKPHPEMN